LIVTQFTGFLYYYTPDGVYHRGPWYPLLLAPPIMSMLLLFAVLLHWREKLSRRQFTAFLIYIVLPLAGMLIQLAFYGLYAIVLFTTFAAMFLYVSVQMDQVERYVRQQEELSRQRASIMVLQMRPHFIYNTLLSIYYLCRQDPDKAQQVVLDFSSYLRQNFTAIAKEDTIPFSEELEHTRAYLAVETARFEKKLFVHYDTPHTRFRLPPLTLQPIVENAVKHGLDPSLGPLEITVRTRETDRGSEIVVEDSGPGFAPADDDEPHIALANIRERLELMCGGSLAIRSGDTGGTTVTITIPDQKPNP
jgi:LytS/YehU family sensor histidine kinase